MPWPSLDFVDNPGGKDPKAVALTFDDGPDGSSGYGGTNNTAYILDQLKALNLKATFFLCDHVWTDVASDPLAQQDIQRMISEGHDVANHTLDHNNLSNITAAQIDAEFAQNANALAIPEALGVGFEMTMYRVPFGVPYQDNTSDVARVAPVTVKYGVHIGWGIDTNDWDCAQSGQDSNCIINNLNAQLDAGHAGVILMHAVYKLTGDTLPRVVQSLNSHGMHIVSVEQLIQDKYGMTSAQIASVNAGQTFSSQTVAAAAANACSENDFDINPLYPASTTSQE